MNAAVRERVGRDVEHAHDGRPREPLFDRDHARKPRFAGVVAVMRRILGGCLFFTGIVWIGQGLGWITGSFMTGSTFWAVTGGVCVVAASCCSAGRGGSRATR